MKKILFVTLLSLFFCNSICSQSFELGPMFAYESTTLSANNGVFGEDENGSTIDILDRKNNFSAGIYFAKDVTSYFRYGAELFYGRHTATRLDGITVDALNFIPYLSGSILNTNLHLNGGIGIGYIINISDNNGVLTNTRDIDIPLKMSLSYHVKNKIIIEVGVKISPIPSFEVEEELKRNSLFAGIKIPVNQYF